MTETIVKIDPIQIEQIKGSFAIFATIIIAGTIMLPRSETQKSVT